MQSIFISMKDNKYSIVPNDFTEWNGLLYEQLNIGEILLKFSDIDLNTFAQKINFPIVFSNNYQESIAGYIAQCRNKLFDEYEIFAYLMLNEIEEELLKLSDNYQMDIKKASETLNNEMNSIFRYFAILKIYIDWFATNKLNNTELNKFILTQQSVNAKYYLSDDGKPSICFEIKNISSLIAFEFVNLSSNNIPFKKCKNCGKVFIPAKRSDEIYCDRIYRNDKTCKQIGYEEKAKADPFMQAYTKARKTQHARIRYNSHIENYKEKHYEPWREAAEKARDSFKENNDIDGFIRWLDDNKNSF